MTVISLAQAKAEREPHWSGNCVCLGCRHEWVGVGPMGTHVCLQCPSCDLPKGVVKHPFGCPEGALLLGCNCDCEALTAYKHNGHFHVTCMACGTDLTHAFYEG